MEILWNYILEIFRRWGILSEDFFMGLGLFFGITYRDKKYFLGKGVFKYLYWLIVFNFISYKINRDYFFFREYDFFIFSSMNSFYNKLCENM